MTNDLQTIWCASATDHGFTNPEDLMNRTSKFERKVRIRNLIEYAAGALVVIGCVPVVVMFASMGEIALAASMALVAIGAIVVMWNLHARASAEKRQPETDCRSHLIGQHRRQASALRSVPLWYIGPILPGVLAVYGTFAVKAAGVVPWLEMLDRIGKPLGLTLAFFAFVIWINLRAARSLERKADELEAA